ncbi:MAG: hypothetical protein WC680_10165 [Sulfuricurvum sp.]
MAFGLTGSDPYVLTDILIISIVPVTIYAFLVLKDFLNTKAGFQSANKPIDILIFLYFIASVNNLFLKYDSLQYAQSGLLSGYANIVITLVTNLFFGLSYIILGILLIRYKNNFIPYLKILSLTLISIGIANIMMASPRIYPFSYRIFMDSVTIFLFFTTTIIQMLIMARMFLIKNPIKWGKGL